MHVPRCMNFIHAYHEYERRVLMMLPVALFYKVYNNFFGMRYAHEAL